MFIIDINIFRNEHKSEWIYREPRLTSLAEACDRMVEFVHHALGHNRVEILPPERDFDENKLKASVAYIQVTHVEPCSISKLLQQEQQKKHLKTQRLDSTATNDSLEHVGFGAVADDIMCYKLHTNIKTFVYEERITDETAPSNAPEQARLAVKRIVLTGFLIYFVKNLNLKKYQIFYFLVEKTFPNTRRRQRVVSRSEFILSPLDVACDSLIFKASQIRKILNAAGINRGAYGFDKSVLRRLDLKQLQLFLQGSVSPTVRIFF